MPKTNIFSNEWCRIVFDSRLKEYGAYEMRTTSSNRHRISIIITIAIFISVFLLPKLIRSIIPERKEVNVEVTSLAKIDLEKNKQKVAEPIIEQAPPEKIKSTIKFTPPVIKDDSEVKDEDIMKTQEEVNDSKLSISVADVEGNSNDLDAVDLADLQQEQNKVVEENEQPFTVVEQMPEFPGGDEARVAFLRENLKFPQIARESGITGTVYLTFVIGKDGRISNVRLLRGIGGGCDEEAIRVLKLMPPWIPGKQGGKSVPVQFNLPIKFTLAG
ncbi:MAG: periplasmic protein TonB [Bacteroidetes bacterium]|nr:MAG: periplasmic protein TonB [Bacteroidota bacterium]